MTKYDSKAKEEADSSLRCGMIKRGDDGWEGNEGW
jgi:hypothetical protein